MDIIVIMWGGMVEDVLNIPSNVVVEISDYDIDGVELDRLTDNERVVSIYGEEDAQNRVVLSVKGGMCNIVKVPSGITVDIQDQDGFDDEMEYEF